MGSATHLSYPHLSVMATRLLSVLALVLACLTSTTSTTSTTRLDLSQRQACYHQPYNRELVCQCSDQANYLNLRLSEFVVRARQEISKIQINSCPDLVLAINLDKVDPGVVQTLEIKNVQKIKITSVRFDPRYENQQRLKVKFSNVVSATIQDVEVTETLEVEVKNVKSFSVLNSTFAHIPQVGIYVETTGQLEIKDNIFMKVYPMSIKMEKTRYIEVRNNQFSLNAIQVISYREGSSVLISCNRLLGDFIKPECITTTSTTTVTTSTTTKITTTTKPTTTTTSTTIAVDVEPTGSSTAVVAVLIILLSLLLIIISGIIAAVCFLKWNKIKKEFFQVTSQAPLIEEKEKEESEPLSKVEIPVPPPPPPPIELEALLSSKSNKDKVQLFAPIWLEEIQNNKIYKKYSERNQKIDEEKTQENRTEEKISETKEESGDGAGNQDMNNTEEKENSRTESDQDC